VKEISLLKIKMSIIDTIDGKDMHLYTEIASNDKN
jgi:hypothetical protein